MNKKIIIFDLDGTLVDTQEIVLQALNTLSEKYKFKVLNPETIVKLRNSRSKHFLKVLDISIFRAPFLIRHVQKMMGTNIASLHFVEGWPDVLLKLKEEGYTLGVATSNSKKNTNLFLEKFNGQFFDFIETDISPFRKHKALRRIAQKHNVSLNDLMYVGDETRDIVSARKAGVTAISVTWGFNTREILETTKPDYIADKPSDILTYITNL